MYSVIRSIILNEQMYEPKTAMVVSQCHTEEYTPQSMKHLLFTQICQHGAGSSHLIAKKLFSPLRAIISVHC